MVKLATKYNISSSEIERVESAFITINEMSVTECISEGEEQRNKKPQTTRGDSPERERF